MKRIVRFLFFAPLMVTLSISLHAQSIPFDSLYLAQTPPGNIPQIFNLPITNGLRPIERIAITSDGKEIYFGELNTYPPSIQNTKCLKYLDNHWQGPFEVFNGYASPRLSANDSTMYIQTNISDFSTTYYSKRIATGWSTPVKLNSTSQQTHYFQTTGLNNAYLSSNLPSSPSQRDICRMIINKADTLIEGLGTPINTTYDENDLFVADDESYLLFSRNSSKGGDIFISFNKVNGKWTNPKNLGAPINKSGYSWEYGQFVPKNSKYLFFTSGGTSMGSYYTYWVKIDSLIDCLKNTNFVPYLNNQIPAQSIKVGNVFSYTVPDSTFVDDDGNNTLSYSAMQSDGSSLPAWLSFDTLTYTFSGTPIAASTLNIKVSAKDSKGVVVSCVFNINITSVDAIEGKNESLPETYNLNQNFPNPFNPTTEISYQIPINTSVSLKVFDMLGRKVATLVDEMKVAGKYSVQFNTQSIASGIYFYELRAGAFVCAKKMMAMK